MTLAELSKILQLQPSSKALERFKGMTFLQFWEAIGKPEKNGRTHPCYDYELDIVSALEREIDICIS